MRPVYSASLYRDQLNNTSVTLTAPGGFTTVIREITMFGVAGPSGGDGYLLVQGYTGLQVVHTVHFPSAVVVCEHLELREVLEPSTPWQLQATGLTVAFSVSGYLLSLP